MNRDIQCMVMKYIFLPLFDKYFADTIALRASKFFKNFVAPLYTCNTRYLLLKPHILILFCPANIKLLNSDRGFPFWEVPVIQLCWHIPALLCCNMVGCGVQKGVVLTRNIGFSVWLCHFSLLYLSYTVTLILMQYIVFSELDWAEIVTLLIKWSTAKMGTKCQFSWRFEVELMPSKG